MTSAVDIPPGGEESCEESITIDMTSSKDPPPVQPWQQRLSAMDAKLDRLLAALADALAERPVSAGKRARGVENLRLSSEETAAAPAARRPEQLQPFETEASSTSPQPFQPNEPSTPSKRRGNESRQRKWNLIKSRVRSFEERIGPLAVDLPEQIEAASCDPTRLRQCEEQDWETLVESLQEVGASGEEVAAAHWASRPDTPWSRAQSPTSPLSATRFGSKLAANGGRRVIPQGSPSGSSRRGSASTPLSVKGSNNVGSMSDSVQKFLLSKERSKYLDSIWLVLEDTEGDCYASVYSWIHYVFVWLSVGSAILFAAESAVYCGDSAELSELLIDALFFVEICLRFLSCPSRRGFLLDAYNVIDMLSAAVPLLLRLFAGFPLAMSRSCTAWCSLLLGFTPLLRILRLLRRFRTFHLLLRALRISLEALPMLVFFWLLITLLGTALIYNVEPRSNVNTYGEASWLTVVSIMTVGYGDVTPDTDWGKVCISGLVFMTALYMAVPLGIIGSAFNDVWSNRKDILLLRKTRERLLKAGYTRMDISMVFRLFDTDRSGHLDHTEFAWMVQGMRCGFGLKHVDDLFEYFDAKGRGVEEREFVKAVFPGEA